MLKSHEKFHSANGKRQILIVDDEMTNREILGNILKSDYDVLYASDGNEALDMIKHYRETLSMVLLDILMPGMSGIDVLKAAKENNQLAHIPIIVTTSENETEIECLSLGAIDFISKPYPKPDVIQLRVQRTIELSEDRDIIESTERDELTGLYNREYFYKYAEQFDQYHKDKDMDAFLVDINHFHMINERYGRTYGDEVLRWVGQKLRETVRDDDGFVCRQDADTFLVYCAHREDYSEIIEKLSFHLADSELSENRVRLRMGVYPHADKSIDIEQRFDRAKMASDLIKGNFTKTIAFYDNELHEKQIYAERLIEDFPAAISENQFRVFYQPKFDIRPDTPVLASAEALVRWEHPVLGMISPGDFIPLFEDNGLIEGLDQYVWKETARQIRAWKDSFGYSVPVSVNVSRIDLYNSSLAETLLYILDDNGLTSNDMILEITESTYTDDADEIIKAVESLRSIGFQIEMDDFGTGYSSLHMLSNMPIDALKLDMQFIRAAFSEGGNTHMLEIIIEMAKYLAVPVIAEGVETEDQMHALKLVGTDLVQGYFFSRPVPASDFEPFILQRKEADISSQNNLITRDDIKEEEPAVVEEHDLPDNTPVNKEGKSDIQLKTASAFFVVLAFIAAAAILILDFSVTRGYQRMEVASDRYIAAELAASDMEIGSDYLTDRVRCFVVTGETAYLNDFVEEINVTRRRDLAVDSLEELLPDRNSAALESLNSALALSNELVVVENKAMRLVLEAGTYDMSKVPDEIKNVELSKEELAMTANEQRNYARSLVFDNNYMHYKDKIRENVGLCTQELIHTSSQELEKATSNLSMLVRIQTVLTLAYLLIVLTFVILISKKVRRPLTKMVSLMESQDEIPPTGVEELQYVTRVYNKILNENKEAREKLSHEASHDALTGLFNRGAYDLLMEDTDTTHIALILIDVDYFKNVNDTYGHAVGDRVLKRVAEILRASFRSADILCRIGGDEFAVVMTRVDSSMKGLVKDKIDKANNMLQHPKDDLPPVSLSVGVAFSDREQPEGDIFKDADSALYKVKVAGRNGYAFYE